METNKLPKTGRVVVLLEELAEKEGQRAVLLSGPYAPHYVTSVAQDLTFELAEIGAEIVQIVRDLESARGEV